MLTVENIYTLLGRLFKTPSYGEHLENYIVSHNPKTSGDIERLEKQWQQNKNHIHGGQWL
jgi:hypothetical protein